MANFIKINGRFLNLDTVTEVIDDPDTRILGHRDGEPRVSIMFIGTGRYQDFKGVERKALLTMTVAWPTSPESSFSQSLPSTPPPVLPSLSPLPLPGPPG